MSITPEALRQMESDGWAVEAGLWTAEGHQLLLRRDEREQFVTVTESGDAAGEREAASYDAGLDYGRRMRTTRWGTPARRALAADTNAALAAITHRWQVEEFLLGLSVGMGAAAELPHRQSPMANRQVCTGGVR